RRHQRRRVAERRLQHRASPRGHQRPRHVWCRRRQPDRRVQMNRRLYRCRENRVLAGVASGVAEFFDLDPTLVRVLWFISILFGGIGLIVYIGMAIIVPIEPLSIGGTAGGEHGATSGEGTVLV